MTKKHQEVESIEDKDKTPVVENSRYYQNDEPKGSHDEELKPELPEPTSEETVPEDVIKANPHKRPRLGTLPSFIPI